MRVVTRWLFVGIWVTLLCGGAVAQGNHYAAPLPLNRIVDALEKAQAGIRPAVSYQIVREYRLSGSTDSRSDSEVVAELDFRPPASKDYRIQKSSGSGRGLQVVRRVLDHEVATASNEGRSALTRDNYDFSYIGDTSLDGQQCYILELKPKRKETDLITGQIWVDEHSFVVRHIQGELAKSPSWWLKRVSVKLNFSEVGGAWLQTEMEATAEVRMAGPHTLTSRTLDYRPTNDFASVGLSIQFANRKP
jgi:Outer membrane lipoprotein-sorting protein